MSIKLFWLALHNKCLRYGFDLMIPLNVPNLLGNTSQILILTMNGLKG